MPDECVRVCVRCRPFNSREKDRKEHRIIHVDQKAKTITIEKPEAESGEPPRTFTFDFVYDGDCRQIDVFKDTTLPIVDSVVGGYNATVFAYGQTGSGKTWSMEGDRNSDELMGIMPRSFHHVWHSIKSQGVDTEFLVRMQFLEIYKEQVYDLLTSGGRKQLEVKESKDRGVFVKDLSSYVVKNVPDMMDILNKGQNARAVGATAMNPGSSRSHSVLTVTVESSVTLAGAEDASFKAGRLNLVDLAGSERQKRTGATGARLEEAKSINLSLSALGNVIKALVSNKKGTHIPYRDSKLTRLLQDSLGGNTKTCMLAAMSPGSLSYDETMSTLRYADRAKNIKNKPKINEDPKDTMLREMQEQIAALKARLQGKGPLPPGFKGAGGGGGAPGQDTITEEKIIEQVEVVETGISEEDMKRLEEELKQGTDMLEGKTKEEIKKIVEEKAKLEAEAKKKAAILKKQQEEMQKYQDSMAKLAEELAAKENAIQSGQASVEEAQRQQELAREVEEKAQQQAEAEKELQSKLEEAEEHELLLEENYSNAKEELKMKTRKLKKLWVKFNEKKEDLKDLHAEFGLEREDLIETIRALDKQIKLKHLIVDSFVPPNYVEVIEQVAKYDSVNDRWVVAGLQYAGNNIVRQSTRHGPDPMRYMADKNFSGDPDYERKVAAAMAQGGGVATRDQFFSYQGSQSGAGRSPMAQVPY